MTEGASGSIYDKVRRKVDEIVKMKEEPRLFRKSQDKYQSAKLFEKKHLPLAGQSYEEEESRELNIIKGQIPKIADKPEQAKEIFVQRVRIHPVAYHKPASNTSTVKDQWTGDSSFSGSDIKDIREKMLSFPSDIKAGNVEAPVDGNSTFKHLRFDIKTIEPFANQIQSSYASPIKAKSRVKLAISAPLTIFVHGKCRPKIYVSDHHNYVQQSRIQSSTKKTRDNSIISVDELNELKENNLHLLNETKFLSMSVDQLQREVVDLKEELKVCKFDRDNAITNFNQASKKIQEMNAEVDASQRKMQKTSAQFGELIDYLYRTANDKCIDKLEEIVGTQDKRMIEEAHWKIKALNTKLAEVAQLAAAAKDKTLAQKIDAVVKR